MACRLRVRGNEPVTHFREFIPTVSCSEVKQATWILILFYDCPQ